MIEACDLLAENCVQYKILTSVIMFTARMSVKAFELVPAIERINLLSEKASTQVC